MQFLADFDVGSFARLHQGEGNERDLGVAGRRLLLRLRNVLRVYHLLLNFTPDL